MRINKYLAFNLGISRRNADDAVSKGLVLINNSVANTGQDVDEKDVVSFNGKVISDSPKPKQITIIMNKPVGYVCSRDGQGSKTVYDLLPDEHHNLKPVGRLDKDSSGLLLMTNDGDLAHKLTHPSFKKDKQYEVSINKRLSDSQLTELKNGIMLEDGFSKFDKITPVTDKKLTISIHEGRNRQIRRTFEKLGYRVVDLHRISFGEFGVDSIKLGEWELV